MPVAMAAASQLLGHQAGDDHSGADRHCRQQAESSQRCPEQDEFQAGQQRDDRRVDHKSPIEVSRVVQCLQLIPVKTVLPIGGGMQDDARER